MATRIIYKDIAVGAAEDATVAASDAQSISTPALLMSDHTIPRFALCCPDFWLLDGSYDIYDAQKVPLMSTAMSDDSSSFSTAPALTLTFGGNYTSTGISLRFSPLTGDWCSSVTITWYQGSTQLAAVTCSPDSAEFFIAQSVTAFNKISISFGSTNKPRRYVMLSQIYIGIVRTFGVSEMDAASVKQEINPISIEMAGNSLDWTLRSASDTDYIFQRKQPMEAYDDTGLVGIFYVDKSKQKYTGLYDINCVDALQVLDSSSFAAKMYSGATAASVLAEILGNDFTLEIDAELGATAITGLIPDCTRRTALQMVAFRLLAAVDTSRRRTVRVFRCSTDSAAEIPQADTFASGSVEMSDIVTQVQITAHTYTAGSSGDDVITVGGVSYVHTSSVVTVDNPGAVAGDLANVVSIDEQTLIDTSCAATTAAAVLAYYERRSRLSEGIYLNGRAPGDYVTAVNSWGGQITGTIVKLTISLEEDTTADMEVLGK